MESVERAARSPQIQSSTPPLMSLEVAVGARMIGASAALAGAGSERNPALFPLGYALGSAQLKKQN